MTCPPPLPPGPPLLPLAPSPTLLQPQGAPSCFSNTPGTILSQGLGTGCGLTQVFRWLAPFYLQFYAQMPPSHGASKHTLP